MVDEDDNPARDDNGHFLKGVSGNASGKARPQKTKPEIVAAKEAAQEQFLHHLPEVLHKLLELIRDPTTSAQNRVMAINSFLDRALGKPITTAQVTNDVNHEHSGSLTTFELAKYLCFVVASGANEVDKKMKEALPAEIIAEAVVEEPDVVGIDTAELERQKIDDMNRRAEYAARLEESGATMQRGAYAPKTEDKEFNIEDIL
jgi:hypothetical protein